MEQNSPLTAFQSVRFRDQTVRIQTVMINDLCCLRLSDVQKRFPSVSAFCVDDIQLSFLSDEKGKDLDPLRIQAYPDKIIEALEPIGESFNKSIDLLNAIHNDVKHVHKITEKIDANTQEILIRLKHVMTQMYELQEYTTPRYFFILPARQHDWTIINNIKNLFQVHFKLYFLCECSNKPDELHVAPHDGYLIRKPSEFITKYGSYLHTTLAIAKGLLTVGGFVVPQLGHASTTVANTLVPVFEKLENSDWEKKFDLFEEFLERTTDNMISLDTSSNTTEQKEKIPLQGAQLRELESYLNVIDTTKSLGNLYRTVTDHGHVRWVCYEHYNLIDYHRKRSEYIRLFECFGGKFNEKTNEGIFIEINLTTKNIEILCDSLTKGFNMLSLTFDKCSIHENDLEKLFSIIINRSSIRSLILINIIIKVQIMLGISESKYHSGSLAIQINNKSLKVQFLETFQDGDIKLLIKFWSQNKICRTFYLFGGDFNGHGRDFRSYFQTNQETTALILKHLNNIEFLLDFLNIKTSLNHLQLSFWLSPPAILTRFCDALAKNSSLTHLTILDHHCYDDDQFIIQLLKVLRGHNSIKHVTLHIYNIKSSSEKEKCLIGVLEDYSILNRLHISQSIISNKLVKAFVHASQKTNSLSHLEFYDCQIDEKDISALEMLHIAQNLNNLSFSKEQYWFTISEQIRNEENFQLNQYENKFLEKILQQQKDFSDIYLYKLNLIDKDIEFIIKEAIQNKKSTGIYLGSNKITSIGAFILSDFLKNDNKLENLWLYDNQICDNGIYSISKALLINNTLHKLDLGKNKITNEGIKHLCQMIQINKTIKYLYLHQNEINDQGIILLSNVIRYHNSTIQVLFLSENKFLTDLSVNSLVQMIQYNQSIKDLRLTNCNLTDKGKEKLQMFQQSKDYFQIFL